MIDRDFPWPNDFDFKPASSGPGFALAPGDISIDIGKARPMAKIAKHFPGKRGACLGKDCVLQILHLLLLPRTGFNEGTGPENLSGQGQIRKQLAQSSGACRDG